MIQLADKSKALGRLEIAFRACPDDFDALKRSVQAGLVSLYDIRGDGYDVTLAGGVNKDSLTFAESALEDIASSNSENLQMLAGLSGGQAKQNAENLNAIMDLAKFKQDNGASENKQQQIILLVVIVIVLGLVAMMAVKR
ncbi:chemotaxis protein [Vibrio cholerae]|nr:chemotaxis protein [Vibrio cholerae]EKF9881527.1 chemotaxis protein [Vibrio cholerae]